MKEFISGIQQVGIGVKNANESLHYYKALFGMDVLVFDDISDAKLMTQYTNNTVCNRHALLSLNMQGGGGVEIWQFTNRIPAMPVQEIAYGDLGVFSAKIKTPSVNTAYEHFKKLESITLSDIVKDPIGNPHFWVRDKYNNYFDIVTSEHWFQPGKKETGGVCGAVIGVSDMNNAINFYADVFGINEIVYDETNAYSDTPGKDTSRYRRVLLHKRTGGKGAFNKLLGSIDLELVQCLDRLPIKIYKDRCWGDCGFIHLCFDVLDMDSLKAHALSKGFSFSVDSNNSFVMENASGRFCYVEDSDGTLIELVETHKVPILKKLGWYLDLKKRKIEKPLPDWMIKMLSLSKVK